MVGVHIWRAADKAARMTSVSSRLVAVTRAPRSRKRNRRFFINRRTTQDWGTRKKEAHVEGTLRRCQVVQEPG
ncbi:unnamed protein product, partial [Nesidiocoris tenuis]